MKTFVISLLALVLFGCAATAKVDERVNTLLKSPCKELFLKGGLGSYQHAATVYLHGKAVFALGQDDRGYQKCAYASAMDTCISPYFDDNDPNSCWPRNEAAAIDRCDRLGGIQAKCYVFARNNEIVWNPSTHIKIQRPEPQTKPPEPQPTNSTADISDAKAKCADLGFTPNTEGFGKCVLRITK